MQNIKNPLFLIITALIVFSCGTTKPKAYPDYVVGIKENKDRKLFDRDSLHIVTPSIEIHKNVNNVSERKYDDREVLKSFVIETLKSELNKSEHYELSLMSEDYLTVNRVLEYKAYQTYKNPEWIVQAPEEILISDKKYTILISMTGRYGKMNSGVIYYCVINNRDKIFETVDRYEFRGSPMDNKKMKKRIQKALARIIKT